MNLPGSKSYIALYNSPPVEGGAAAGGGADGVGEEPNEYEPFEESMESLSASWKLEDGL